MMHRKKEILYFERAIAVLMVLLFIAAVWFFHHAKHFFPGIGSFY